MEFRGLRREDDRSKFSCGSEEIDKFFRLFAGQNQFTHQIGVSYVLVEGNRIAAFVTVASGSVTLPEDLRGRMPAHPLPVLLVARLEMYRHFGFRPIADPNEAGIQRHFLGIRHFQGLVEAKSAT